MTTTLSTKPLTGQQRINRMLGRKDHDRIPRSDAYWPETITRWQTEGLAGSWPQALERLGVDFHGICWCWPAPYPGRREVIASDEQTETIIDENGKTVRYWKDRSGTPEHSTFECDSPDIWFEKIKPTLLATPLHIKLENVLNEFRQARKNSRWAYLAGVEPFECTRQLMGDEITLMSMATDPDWIRDVARTFVDLLLRDYQAVLDAGAQPDGLWTYGDMAYNHATMCSPDMYRDLIWPEHKRMAEWAHAHGMKFIYHTDGDVNGVIDLYIAAGFDCLQPLEAKANMDIRRLCPRYGKRLAFFGNIDVMVLMTNDRDRIEPEVKSKLAAGMATRGYAYHSDHSVPPQVSWETYLFLIDLLDKYGCYDQRS